MIAQVTWGIAAGLMWMSGLAAWRFHNSDRAVRVLLLSSAALSAIALPGSLFDSTSAATWPGALVVLLILSGGVLYRLRGFTLTPGALLATATLLTLSALGIPRRAALEPAEWITVLSCIAVLPAFDSAARHFRKHVVRFDASIVLWFGLSLAMLTGAIINLIQRGLWLEGNISLLVAWLAAGGSLMFKRGRPRALMIFVAACALVAQTWHVLI